MIKRGTLATLLCALLISACGKVATQVASSADATRAATERVAANARAADQDRVARIAEAAEPLRQAEAVAFGERYFIREQDDGWAVVDRVTNAPAVAGLARTGQLSYDDAKKVAEELRDTTSGP
jgi:hypothetical protein